MHSLEKSSRLVDLLMPGLRFAVKTYHGIWWVLLLLFGINFAHAASPDDADQADVTIVLSAKNGFYEEFSNALDSLLTAESVSHRVIDASQTIPDSGLVIAVGMKAASAVMASDASSVINVLITNKLYTKLLHDMHDREASRNVTAIFLDQPYYRQVQLVTSILPDKRNIGILYSIPSSELDGLRQELNEHHLKLHEQKIDPTHTLSDSLQDILTGRSELLLALPDAAVYNDSTIRNILLATYRRGIPLIGYSSSFVKAGALCAVYSTPAQIATQAVRMVVHFKNSHKLPAPQFPREFEVMVNGQVADSLGLQVKAASALHDEIASDIKDTQ
jgi:ABC-type uncharacterized transport system substrate-binding protein